MEEKLKAFNNKKKSTKKDVVINTILIILIALFLTVFLLFKFVFISVNVSGSSMETTLSSGDKLICVKTKNIDYGDVVIIKDAPYTSYDGTVYHKDYLIIKRVIALPNDKVKIENGFVYLSKDGNDYELLEENYVNFKTLIDGEWILGDDEIFYMGDNRGPNKSLDARENGPCKVENILGVVPSWAINTKGIRNTVFNFLEKIFGDFSNKTND